jgi:sec-independent protein translocase protein TatA
MTTGLLNPTHIIFVLAIALLVLGPKRLPELAKSAGNGLREFKGSLEGSLDGHDDAATPGLTKAEAPEKTPVA